MRPIKSKLTPRLQATMLAIHKFTVKEGYSPTDRELAKAMGISGFAAQYRIYHLENLGYITPSKLRQRSREFAQHIEFNGISVPVIGTCN